VHGKTFSESALCVTGSQKWPTGHVMLPTWSRHYMLPSGEMGQLQVLPHVLLTVAPTEVLTAVWVRAALVGRIHQSITDGPPTMLWLM
jgi:hypothetical protein